MAVVGCSGFFTSGERASFNACAAVMSIETAVSRDA